MRQVVLTLIVLVAIVAATRDAGADIVAKCADASYVFTESGCVKRVSKPKSSEAIYEEALDALEQNGKRAFTLFEQTCKKKHGKSCFQLGLLYASGRDRVVIADEQLANTYYEQACAHGEGRGCQRRGSVERQGDRPQAAREWFDKGCKLGDGASCAYLAFMFENGIGGAVDAAGAKETYAKAQKQLVANCKTIGEACHVLGYLAEAAVGEKEDLTKAIGAYKQACAKSHGEGCAALAHALQKNQGSAAEIEEAYRNGCKFEHAESCVDLSIRISERDPKHAEIIPLAQHGCDLDTRQCFTIARWYERGTGLPAPDDARSTATWKSTCEAGSNQACQIYAKRIAAGQGAPADAALALEANRKSCAGNWAEGCKQLAMQLATSGDDDIEAYQAALKGCGGNNAHACYVAGFLAKNNRRGLAKQDEADAAREAVGWFVEGCDGDPQANSPHACHELGLLQQSGLGTTQDIPAAYASFTKACYDPGDVVVAACTEAARIARSGEGLPAKDPKAAVKIGARACAFGDIAECNLIVRAHKDDLAGALDELAARCKASDEISCIVEGDLRAQGSASDKQLALQTYAASCKRGSQLGCLREANLVMQGIGGPADPARATAMLTELCQADYGSACQSLTLRMHAIKDFVAALQWAQKGCALDDAGSCTMVGFYHFVPQPGIAWDTKIGADAHEKACNLGDATGCANMAEVYRYGFSRPVDPKQAYEYGKKACEMGAQFGCADMAHWLSIGQGVGRDTKQAIQLLRAACEDPNPPPTSCTELGQLLEREQQGTPAEIARLKGKGFSIVEKEALTNNSYKWWLGAYYLEGIGTPKDPKRALELFEESCKGYWALACIDAGKILSVSADVSDRERGKSYFERACAAGVDEGCKGMEGKLAGPTPVRQPKGCGCSGEVLPGAHVGMIALVMFVLVGPTRRRRRA